MKPTGFLVIIAEDEREENGPLSLNRSHSQILFCVDPERNTTPIPGDLNKPPSERMKKFLNVIFRVLRIRDSGS